MTETHPSPLKVLHVINTLSPAGAEKLVADMLPLFNERRLSADLLLLNGQSTWLLEELRAHSCCSIYDLGSKGIYNPINIVRLANFVRRYEVVHAHLFPSFYYVALARLLVSTRTKLVVTEHSTSNRRMASALFKKIDRKLYSLYDSIICLNPEVHRVLLAHTRLPPTRFHVVSNGVNLNEYRHALAIDRSAIDASLAATDKLLIQVSAFRNQKDQLTLIRAVQNLPTNVKLLLVGDGPEKNKCEAAVMSLNLGNRVFFLGVRADVPRLLKSCDVVVLSTHYEGFSLASIEGMASGRPFVGSDVPGLSEFVRGAGLLFPEGDHHALSETIIGLLRDSDHYRQVSDACEERAAEFDIVKTVNGYVDVYESLSG